MDAHGHSDFNCPIAEGLIMRTSHYCLAKWRHKMSLNNATMSHVPQTNSLSGKVSLVKIHPDLCLSISTCIEKTMSPEAPETD